MKLGKAIALTHLMLTTRSRDRRIVTTIRGRARLNELRRGEKAAAAAYRGELRTARQNIRVLLANVIASIVLAWVVVWGVIGIVRWMKRGFEF
jgi:hypothetical protein